jgi:serine/threonine protein kinase
MGLLNRASFTSPLQVLYGLPFGTAVDVWSLGCVLVELYTGNALFPASGPSDLAAAMHRLLGTPPPGFANGKFFAKFRQESAGTVISRSENQVRVLARFFFF